MSGSDFASITFGDWPSEAQDLNQKGFGRGLSLQGSQAMPCATFLVASQKIGMTSWSSFPTTFSALIPTWEQAGRPALHSFAELATVDSNPEMAEAAGDDFASALDKFCSEQEQALLGRILSLDVECENSPFSSQPYSAVILARLSPSSTNEIWIPDQHQREFYTQTFCQHFALLCVANAELEGHANCLDLTTQKQLAEATWAGITSRFDNLKLECRLFGPHDCIGKHIWGDIYSSPTRQDQKAILRHTFPSAHMSSQKRAMDGLSTIRMLAQISSSPSSSSLSSKHNGSSTDIQYSEAPIWTQSLPDFVDVQYSLPGALTVPGYTSRRASSTLAQVILEGQAGTFRTAADTLSDVADSSELERVIAEWQATMDVDEQSSKQDRFLDNIQSTNSPYGAMNRSRSLSTMWRTTYEAKENVTQSIPSSTAAGPSRSRPPNLRSQTGFDLHQPSMQDVAGTDVKVRNNREKSHRHYMRSMQQRSTLLFASRIFLETCERLQASHYETTTAYQLLHRSFNLVDDDDYSLKQHDCAAGSQREISANERKRRSKQRLKIIEGDRMKKLSVLAAQTYPFFFPSRIFAKAGNDSIANSAKKNPECEAAAILHISWMSLQENHWTLLRECEERLLDADSRHIAILLSRLSLESSCFELDNRLGKHRDVL